MTEPSLPLVQYRPRPGTIDLAWGHPDPDLLPVDAWPEAVAGAVRRHGWRALTYGWAAGPGPLVDWLCDRLGRTDGRPPAPAEVVVTAGASAALHLVASLLARPGEVALVESPSYHLAHRILADQGLRLVPVATDAEGPDVDALRAATARERAAGRRVALLYTVPTFNNPTGASVTPRRRAALVAAAAELGVLVVEDDTYRELSYEGPAPGSLFATAPAGTVVRIGSFAKSVAPGLRLGFLTAAPDVVARLAASGALDSGGGLNHTSALALAEFGATGAFDRHLARVRAEYRRRRDTLVAALAEAAPQLSLRRPDGGWFVWARLPAGMTAAALAPVAAAAGVGYVPGHVFGAGTPDDAHLRLSFSLHAPGDLITAARRLGVVLGHMVS